MNFQWCELYNEFILCRLNGDEKGLRRCTQNILIFYKELHGEDEDYLRIKKILLLYPEDLTNAIQELEWIRNTIHWECRHSNPSYITNDKLKNRFKKIIELQDKERRARNHG